MENPEIIVRKSGGTSVAHPDRVYEHVMHSMSEAPGVWVFSAPGADYPGACVGEYETKMTNMLLDYEVTESVSTKTAIIDRLTQVATRGLVSSKNQGIIKQIVDAAPNDLVQWRQDEAPIAALGEYWATGLMAAYLPSDLTKLVDAAKIIAFTDDVLDREKTDYNVKKHLSNYERTRLYLMAGFYGADQYGKIKVLSRGGSDQSGAEVSRALNAREYHNYSDVDGFRTANPKMIDSTRLLEIITHREQRELANSGTALLHSEVGRILTGTGINVVMRNTFADPRQRGTIVTDEREHQAGEVIGVNLNEVWRLNLQEFGMDGAIGSVEALTHAVTQSSMPIQDILTGKDVVAFTFEDDEDKTMRPEQERKLRAIAECGGADLTRVGRLNIVGEGLGAPSIERTRRIAKFSLALADAGVADLGGVSLGDDNHPSLGAAIFVRPEDGESALKAAHNELLLPT